MGQSDEMVSEEEPRRDTLGAVRRRDTSISVVVILDVARVVVAIGLAVALIIAAAYQMPLPRVWPW